MNDTPNKTPNDTPSSQSDFFADSEGGESMHSNTRSGTFKGKRPKPVINWKALRVGVEELPLRKATLWMGPLALAYIFLNVFFLQENFLFAVCCAVGICVGAWVMAAVVASVLALPGWLVRGQYQFKVIMIGMIGCSTAGALVESCKLIALSSVGKFLAIPLLIILGFFTTMSFLFTFFTTLTPIRWSSKVGKVSTAFAILAGIGSLTPVLSQTPNERGRQLFGVQRSATLKMLAGKAVTLDTLSDDLAGFSKSQEAGRKPSIDLAVLDAPPDVEALPIERVPATAGPILGAGPNFGMHAPAGAPGNASVNALKDPSAHSTLSPADCQGLNASRPGCLNAPAVTKLPGK